MVVTSREKARLTRAWRLFDIEAKALNRHYRAWTKRYPDQFIAVHDGRVVAASPDPEALLRTLTERGLRPTQVLIRFMAKEPRRFLL